MNRRTFGKLAGLAALGTGSHEHLTAERLDMAQGMVRSGNEALLEDAKLLIAFDTGSGAIVRFERKTSVWKISRRSELGISFRMLAPIHKQRGNFILGQKQHASRVEKVGSNKIELEWKDPISEHGGVVPLTLTASDRKSVV